MFSLKNTNRIKPFFVLPFILAMTGCDNMGGISCDGEDEISSIKQQIDNERMKQKQQSSVLSYFLRPLILDGSFDIKDVEEKKRDKEQKILTCSANVIFSPDSEYGKSQRLPVEYKVNKTGESLSVNLTNVGERSIIDSQPTEGQKKYKAKMDEQKKIIEEQRAEEEKRIKAEREKAEKEEEERLAKEAELNKKIDDELTAASLLSDDKFIPVSKDDLLYIFIAQSGRAISDREKLEMFSAKWNSTQDAFVKRDIEKDELEKINRDIDKFRDVKNIQFYINKRNDKGIINLPVYQGRFRLDPAYNFDTQSFPVSGEYCKNNPHAHGQILNYRGIKLTLDRVLNSCELKIPESDARSLSDRLNSNVSVDIVNTVNAHIIGFNPEQNKINIAILRQNVEIITQKRGEQKVTINTVFK